MTVLAPTATVLWRRIESYGLDPQPFFAAEGIELQWPVEPGTRLPYESLDRVRAAAYTAIGDPDFGLQSSDIVHPSQLGALGYAWLASSTLREALVRFHRFVRVINDQAYLELFETGGSLRVLMSVRSESLNERAREDGMVSYLVNLCRMNCGAGFNPGRVGFRYPRPADTSAHEALFRCSLRFGCEHNEIDIPSDQADRPLSSANPLLAKMNEQIVARRLALLDQSDIPNRVRGAIMEQLPSGNVTDESVATFLNMSSRTMHRKLRKDNETFRSILKSVRQELAEQFMADNSLSLTEITFLLGFSEISSFSRAYKNWHGVSPSQARAQSDQE